MKQRKQLFKLSHFHFSILATEQTTPSVFQNRNSTQKRHVFCTVVSRGDLVFITVFIVINFN